MRCSPSSSCLASLHAATSALPTLHEFFAPGGLLAQSSLAYEHRKGQYEMARAVEKALEDKRHLIVEAGTGTGKTLAYLLPALRMARDRGQRVIISTGTKNLQEQLFFKDIPFLESILGPLKVCTMKGRANYVCKQKLYALAQAPLLTQPEEIRHFHIIQQWEETTATGDRAEIAGLPEPSPLFSKMDARSEACLGQTCPNFEPCYITEMRKKALESDLIIVNHHLFFADLNIKQQAAGAPDAGVLPEAAAVIFDEAHEMEAVASDYFGVSISQQRCEELARDTEIMLRAKSVSSSSVESATANAARPQPRLLRLAAHGRLPARPPAISRPARLPGRARRKLCKLPNVFGPPARRAGAHQGRGRGQRPEAPCDRPAYQFVVPHGGERPEHGVLD